MNTNRWLVLALLVSLAINLLIAGVVIGRHLDGGAPSRMHFEWLMQDLDDATRSKMRKNMHEQMKNTRPHRHDLRQAQRALHEAILTEPFEEDRVKAAMAEVRAASARLQQTMHDQMIQILSEMSAEDRTKVFSILSRMERRRHGLDYGPGQGRGAPVRP